MLQGYEEAWGSVAQDMRSIGSVGTDILGDGAREVRRGWRFLRLNIRCCNYRKRAVDNQFAIFGRSEEGVCEGRSFIRSGVKALRCYVMECIVMGLGDHRDKRTWRTRYAEQWSRLRRFNVLRAARVK